MEDSMAQAGAETVQAPPRVELAAWKAWTGTICAAVLGLLFIVAGVWKLSDPLGTSARMAQALLPAQLALATALGAGIVELWAGLLLLVPGWRRWGALLTGAMLVAFMVYMAVNYTALQGEDCSCFPWLQRVVGPEFFISDAAMLALAAAAWVWARPSRGWRAAAVPLAVITLAGGAWYGVAVARQSGLQAPDSIVVDGKPVSLKHGRVFLYFFDPQCAHCLKAARQLGEQEWEGVRRIAVVTATPQWGRDFLEDAKFEAGLSTDADKLRAVFQFTDPPYAVALEHGRQVQAFPYFEGERPVADLKKLGWVN